MKTGPLIGWFGCILWLVNSAIQSKANWIGISLGVTTVVCLVAGTMIIGVQKRRTGLGIGLSLLSVVFGLGFLIMMLIPKKESHNAV